MMMEGVSHHQCRTLWEIPTSTDLMTTKNVLAESKDPDGILSAALDVIIDSARRSGINVSIRRYLDVALERFDFHGGQDKEDLMAALRGRVGRR